CALATLFFFYNATATTDIYTLSLHDALPILYPYPVPVISSRYVQQRGTILFVEVPTEVVSKPSKKFPVTISQRVMKLTGKVVHIPDDVPHLLRTYTKYSVAGSNPVTVAEVAPVVEPDLTTAPLASRTSYS